MPKINMMQLIEHTPGLPLTRAVDGGEQVQMTVKDCVVQALNVSKKAGEVEWDKFLQYASIIERLKEVSKDNPELKLDAADLVACYELCKEHFKPITWVRYQLHKILNPKETAAPVEAA